MANTRRKIDFFSTQFPLHHYDAREPIISAQEEPRGVFWLAEGKVRQYIFSEEGEELTVHLFEAGSFFPLLWAINKVPNRHWYESLTEVDVRIIPVDDFVEFLKGDAEILYDLSRRLLFGLNGMLLRVESLSLQNANKRVASILMYLARHFGEKQGELIVFNARLTHHDIATYTGLARETTSLEMSKLEKQGLIGYRGSTLIIKDISGLEELLS